MAKTLKLEKGEETILMEALMDFIADFVDAEAPIHPGALVFNPLAGHDVTFGDMVRLIRLGRG